MALIGEIRERSWLLIVLIGLAMAGFIFMDMFSGNRSILSGQALTIGDVEGEEIQQPEFERAYSALYTGSTGDAFAQREQLWNFMVEDELVRREARATGLTVPTEELEDLQWGTNLSPVVQARFRDPQTGQVNRQNLNSYRDAERDGSLLDPEVVPVSRRNFWQFQKREVNKQRLQDKLAALVSKSMYTPDWMAEELAKGNNTRLDVAFVKVPYDAIPDADVEVSDDDLAAYLATDGYRFRRDAPGRAVAYVSFAVAPTAGDSAAYRADLTEMKAAWAAAANDSTYAVRQRGAYPAAYLADGDLPEAVRGQAVGTIVGPYLDADRYTIAKVVDRKRLPDSVRSRHILLKYTTQAEAQRAKSTMDSLENLIATGANTFDELARQFSQGPTSVKGGDLGYVAAGAMVPAFNDLIFYQADEGDLNQVVTQFGLHLVEVTGRKYDSDLEGTRVATISKEIVPSNETQRSRFEAAQRFAQTNRSAEALEAAAAADPALTYEEGIIVGENDYVVGALGSGNASRNIVKFAFDADAGAVSPEVYAFKAPRGFYDGQYVVAAVTDEVAAGIPTPAQARGVAEAGARQMKKAALVAQAGGMDAVARRYGVEPDTARAVNFGAQFVPGLGQEPRAVGTAFKLPANTASEALAGNSGVIIVKPLVRTEPGDVSGSLAAARQAQTVQTDGAVRNGFGVALREGADIEDGRSKFY